MRVVKRRSPWLRAGTVLGAFFLGPLGASRLSAALAPDAVLVEIVSFFGFVLVFVVGTVLWMGLGVASVVLRGLWELLRRRKLRRVVSEPSESLVPPGYRSYAVLGVIAGATVGLLAGVLTPLRMSSAVLVWGPVGLGYGLLLWGAAHYGYLPFPDPE
ncbi:MAG: hypothetical protein HKO53_17530 [Gemmatimonadetes bacterium]|nr:hypothetical protein [Gemmatimonadota bacterium]NNM34883.1 hypothetical protein [Gemmatimonadota bacterium]